MGRNIRTKPKEFDWQCIAHRETTVPHLWEVGETCQTETHSKGATFCGGHKRQVQKGYPLTPIHRRKPRKPDEYDGKCVAHLNSGVPEEWAGETCDRALYHTGALYCPGHRWAFYEGRELRPLRRQRPTGMTSEEVHDLILSRCTRDPDGHLIYPFRKKNGYAKSVTRGVDDSVRMSGRNKSASAYTLLYEFMHGPVKVGMQLHHIYGCGKLGCVDVEHLQLVTAAENVAEIRARVSYERHIQFLEKRIEELDSQIASLDAEAYGRETVTATQSAQL